MREGEREGEGKGLWEREEERRRTGGEQEKKQKRDGRSK